MLGLTGFLGLEIGFPACELESNGLDCETEFKFFRTLQRAGWAEPGVWFVLLSLTLVL